MQSWWVNCLSKKSNFELNKSDSEPTKWPEMKQWWDQLDLASLKSSYTAYTKELDKDKLKRFSRIDNEMYLWPYLEHLFPKECHLIEVSSGTGPNRRTCKVVEFCEWNLCVQHICEHIDGLELYFESLETNSTLITNKKERIEKLSADELATDYIPEDFFGTKLRQQINNGTFQVKGTKEWVPIDRESSAIKHGAPDLTAIMNSFDAMEAEIDAEIMQEKQQARQEAKKQRTDQNCQENKPDGVQQQACN